MRQMIFWAGVIEVGRFIVSSAKIQCPPYRQMNREVVSSSPNPQP